MRHKTSGVWGNPRTHRWVVALRCAGIALAAVWSLWAGRALAATPTLHAVSVATLPHDAQAFTQGLLYQGGYFYESTGLYGRSTIRQVIPATGKVVAQRNLPRTIFGEGLALAGEKLLQLSWKEGRVLVYRLTDLQPLGEFPLSGEGWGVCTMNDGRLVVSDGSNTLTYYEPSQFTKSGALPVTDAGKPVDRLNELESIGGTIWANIWGEKRIAVIDPATGHVLAWIDCASLFPKNLQDPSEDVLNGIAYDPTTKRIWITGKFWPVIHEITVPGLAARTKGK